MPSRFVSVFRTRRDDNMLTYTHQMRGGRKKKKKKGVKNGDRKEGGGEGNIGTNYESQSPSTQRD